MTQSRAIVEDFNKLRLMAKALVHTNFQKQWQFRLEIVDAASTAPTDFDLYIKDVSYNRGEITIEEDQVGSTTYSWPIGVEGVKLTATMRDNDDGRISKYMDEWKDQVVHKDGTVGLPLDGPEGKGYLRKVKKFRLHDDCTETLDSEWFMYPQSLGESSHSLENGEYSEFAVVFVQHNTLPNV